MSDLSNCLSTHIPKIIDFPVSPHEIKDPIRWALDFFRAHQSASTMQVMKWGQDGTPNSAPGLASASSRNTPDGVTPADYVVLENTEHNMSLFMDGVQNGRPVHGRLEVFRITSKGLHFWQDGKILLDVFTSQFLDELKHKSPLGIHAACTLWLSTGGHTYSPHLDLQDGFLFHLTGDKRLRVWPTPDIFRNQAIYSHEDFEGRMNSQPVEFELKPGQVAFIPGGAIHDVAAYGKEPCVSLSLHMGSPYPLLILRNELNRILGEESVFLPAHMCSPTRYLAYLFQPSHFLDQHQSQTDGIPDGLSNELLDVLQSRTLNRDQLRNLLSQWWETSRKELNYQCPYPNEWLN